MRLPLFPKLKVRLITHFAMELVRGVLANELHMALVTAPPSDGKLTTVPYAETHYCAVLPEAHQAAHNEQASLRDLSSDEWILFPRSVNSLIYDRITETAANQGIPTRHAHEVNDCAGSVLLGIRGRRCRHIAEAKCDWGSSQRRCRRDLFDPSLTFETSLIMRRDEDSKLVNAFARTFLRKYVRKPGSSRQMDLPLSA
jgi:DNA-binding transcriptional LysR family regulator